MKTTTLLIMAAGIGSRFGTGIKQLEPVDDTDHIIMDYSIHDAIEAGFNHVVFIIRKDIEKEFKEVIGDRIASVCSAHDVTVDYVFQDIKDIPGTLPEGRTKPWGTGQAVLAAKKVIKTPFIVINADDYYGREGFKAVHEYLMNGGKSCMAGFVLSNTLSDNGGVTRGICKMDENGNLTEILRIGPYSIYFWSNEGDPLEPIHVHVSEGRASATATKIWITSTGKTILSNNNSKIPEKILKRLMRMIEANSSDIIDEWLNRFGEIRYFC